MVESIFMSNNKINKGYFSMALIAYVSSSILDMSFIKRTPINKVIKVEIKSEGRDKKLSKVSSM